MQTITRLIPIGALVLAGTVLGALASPEPTLRGGDEGQAPGTAVHDVAGTPGASVARGRYLVHDVAMCVQCHTPRTDNARLDRRQLLMGAPIPVKSPFRYGTWAVRAPKIAGLPGGWSEEDLVRFLRAGRSPSGHEALPPMPPFRMTEDDARSVALYLKSLVES